MIIEQYIEALSNGRLCLYPAETMPGLGFNPHSLEARKLLYQIKGRESHKPIAGLIDSPESAIKYWKKLPSSWARALDFLWPNSLTIIWKASTLAPESLISTDHEIGLRCPKWPNEFLWMKDLIHHLDYPMPTTSVNISGEKAILSWEKATQFCQNHGIFYPENISPRRFASEPSTVLKIVSPTQGILLRGGVISKNELEQTLRNYNIQIDGDDS